MSDSLLIASDENAKQNPNLELSHKVFLIENKLKKNENIDDLKKIVLDDIQSDSMAALYSELCEKFGWQVEEGVVSQMVAANKASVIEFDRKIVDATENAGETEVLHLLIFFVVQRPDFDLLTSVKPSDLFRFSLISAGT